MIRRIKNLLTRKATPEKWDLEKSAALADVLGEEHGTVMHSIIPYAFGGGLDLYYFSHGIPGTVIATKELIDECGRGNRNKVHAAYELVMATKEPLNLDDAQKDDTAFGRAHTAIDGVLNAVARYGAEAQLSPGETCEFPAEMGQLSNRCLVFDNYEPGGKAFQIMGHRFGLLLVLEVHRSEMEFARSAGSEQLLARLKSAGVYPYSDLNRPPVA